MTTRVLPLRRSTDALAAGRRHAAPRRARIARRAGRARSGGSRARDVARLDPELRARRRQLLAFALAEGRPVDPDAASAVLAAKAARWPEPVELLDDDVVTELLWVDVFAWCGDHGVPPPSGVAATLHTWVDQLASAGRLAPASDPVVALHDAINAAGGVIEQASLPGLEPAPTAG